MNQYATRQTLIQRIQNGANDTSWNDFVYFYKRYIYVIIRNMNISHHDSEDLSQQVLMKVWKGIDKFEYEPNKHRFRSWLSTVTKNTVLNYLSLKSRHVNSVSQSEATQIKLYLNSITVPDVDKVAEEEWENYIANLALERVRSRFSEVVISAFELFVEGLPGKEVAERLNIPPNTAIVYKKRVKQALAEEIKFLDQDLG